VILILASEYPPVRGGIATFTRNIARALAKSGAPVIVATAGGPFGWTDEDGVTMVRVPFGNVRIFRGIGLMLAGLWALRAGRPEVLFCAKATHEIPAAALVKRICRTRLVVLVHGSEIRRQRSFLGAVIRAFMQSAERVVVNSRFTRTLVIQSGVAAHRIAVLQPFIEPRDYSGAHKMESVTTRYDLEGRRVLLTVGQLTARKGHARVMRAVATLLPRYPNLVYVIAGGAGERRRDLIDAARALGLGDSVRFTGYADPADLAALYTLCEIVVMPSEALPHDVEGFGITFIEANLFGKPVIGGMGGGTADAVVDGQTGLLIDPLDARALTAAIGRLLDDEVMRHRLGKAGQARALAEFSVASRVAATVDAIRGGSPHDAERTVA
jgi:phosphatidylinositol alpha-1,6-mannosyltransferase